MSNTIELKGEALFQYLICHFKMTTSEAMAELETRGINTGWFNGLDKGIQTAIEGDDPFLIDYIRGVTT